MKQLFIIFCLLFSFSAFSQTTEWMVLQKKGITVETFFPNKYITFQLDNLQWIEGEIKAIQNDSIFINQKIARIVSNAWGLPVRDTVALGLLKYNIHQIYALPLKNQQLGVVTSGAIFQVAGAGFIVLNAANCFIQNESFFATQNITNVSIAAGVFLFGKILQWNHPSKIILGKKYILKNIKMGV
ncbi:MAG: hypothetical protein JSR09_01365 [Bacteroidetes bacterium]|nr:hypothetical protein [Bacteroidota bacterium]MBS1648328.1 hypothetical protein [Bacteroidota bacterium]